MILRIAVPVILFAFAASAADTTVKDERGRCQAVVPVAGMALPGQFGTPDRSLSLSVDWEPGKAAVMSADELKRFRYSKAYENTATRQWVEVDSSAVPAGRRAWYVYVPAGTGRCYANISFKPGVSEDQLKKIALSLVALK